ncbi:MAG: hypothetical protein ACE5EM_08135 [Sphingomonadales bacterium]
MDSDPKSWTPDELREIGYALYGFQWQSPMARALNINPRTVRRWAAGKTPISPRIQAEIMRLAGARDITPPEWPRDAWIVGDGPTRDGGKRREYIIHARHPRFIARVVEIDAMTDQAEPDEEPVDIDAGVAYAASPESRLCEIVWIDRPPAGAKLHTILEAAADMLESFGMSDM